MPIYKSSESKQGGIKSWIPKARYRARCIQTKLGKSSGGYPMTTLTCEIIDDTVKYDDKLIEVAGRQFPLWLMHVQKEDWGQARVEELCKKFDLDIPIEDDGMGDETMLYNDELHNEYFKGMEFDIILHCEENVKREEKKEGEKQGKAILDGEGNEIKDGWRIMANLDDIPIYCNPIRNEKIASEPI